MREARVGEDLLRRTGELKTAENLTDRIAVASTDLTAEAGTDRITEIADQVAEMATTATTIDPTVETDTKTAGIKADLAAETAGTIGSRTFAVGIVTK